jgi:hypothetical protein
MTLGATAGGMLAAAFLPMAIAHADDDGSTYFGFTLPDDDAFTGTTGFPPLFEYASADDVSLGYDAADDHSGVLSTADFSTDGGSGTIDADVDNLYVTALGASSQTITLNEGLTTDGAGAEGGDTVAGEGSVFNATDFGLGFGNIYTDAVGAGDGGSNEISDVLVTPFGNIDISGLVGGLLDFDAAELGGEDAIGINPGADLLGGGDGDLFGGLFGADGLFSGGGGLLDGLGGLLGGDDGLLGGLVGDGGLLGGLGGLLGGDGDDGLLGGLLGGDDGLLGGLLGGGSSSGDDDTADAIQQLLSSSDGAGLSDSDFTGGDLDGAADALAQADFGDTATADEVSSALDDADISTSGSHADDIAAALNDAGDSGSGDAGGGGLLGGLTDGLGDIFHGDVGGGVGDILGGLGL